jgi:hypothetical protein
LRGCIFASVIRGNRIRPAVAVLVVALACSEGTGPPSPASLSANATPLSGTAGLPLAIAPTIVVKDAAGNVLGGIPLTIQVRAGGGSLTDVPAQTSSGSPTAVGTWTLGRAAAANALTVTVAALQPLVITVYGLPGPAASAAAASGDAQLALAGTSVAFPLALKVSDQFGNGVSGVPVTFTVTAGGGSLSLVAAHTDSSGVAGGAIWRLGRSATAQTVTAVAANAFHIEFTATVASDYTAVVRFFGQSPTLEALNAFIAAADRVRATVIGDVPDIPVSTSNLAQSCGLSYPQIAVTELVDDLLIYATVTSIDGPGNILAAAGPCIIRLGGRSSVLGLVRLDADDLPTLIARGQLEDVIFHEMLHVVGFGVLWRQSNLIADRGTDDPRFTGVLGTAECVFLGGAVICPSTIPVENTGGSGTADSHWRESVFDAELMTGFTEPEGKAMPLSTMTIQSLADMGYRVNVFASDPYTVPIPSSSSRLRTQLQVGSVSPMDEVLTPTVEVTPSGTLRPLPDR